MDKDIFDLKKYTLENGLNIITLKKDTELASFHVGVKIGSIYEKGDEKGISHFIEHMLFKGTKSRTNSEINDIFEQMAGDSNAYTDQDCTVYSITALKEEIKTGVELISDMLKNSIFHKDEMEKERGVILAEIRTSKDDIEDYSYRKTVEIGFKNSSIKVDTLGTKDTVKNLKRSDIIKFYKRYYVPNNTYVVLVSSYEHSEALNLIKKYFNDWEEKEFTREKVVVENNIPIKKTSYKHEFEQSTIVYLYTFHNLTKREELVLRILNYKLGESANSILFRRLREEAGLAYDVYSELNTGKYVKTLMLYASVDEECVEKALKIIDKSIEDINKMNILLDKQNVILMKKVLKTAVAGTIEDSGELCDYVLHQSIDKEDVYQFVDDMKEMEEIESDDIYEVAKKVLKNPTVHILI